VYILKRAETSHGLTPSQEDFRDYPQRFTHGRGAKCNKPHLSKSFLVVESLKAARIYAQDEEGLVYYITSIAVICRELDADSSCHMKE